MRPRRSRRRTTYRKIGNKLYPSEKQIQDSICIYLQCRGIEHSVTDASTTPGRPGKVKPGWPDLSCVLPGGRFMAIEVKSKNGKLRPIQEVVLDSLRRAGALVVVAYSVEDVVKALDSNS